MGRRRNDKEEKFRDSVSKCLPATRKQIEETLGAGQSAVERALKALRGDKKAHIGGWASACTGPSLAVYYPGFGVDEPMPSKKGGLTGGFDHRIVPASATRVHRPFDPLLAAFYGMAPAEASCA